jgi:hypothetical protein
MHMRKLILGTLIAASIAGVSLPAAARTNVDFSINFAPPVAPVEYVPAPRAGYVWVPGYWDWRYSRHYWVKGHWTRHRPGHYYEPVRWVHHNGRYYYRAAGWRDNDGDGVPNRYDARPNNPYWR